MKVDEREIGVFLTGSTQLLIPYYQRNYKWGTTMVAQFLEDLYNIEDGIGKDFDKQLFSHFIGTIILFDVKKFALKSYEGDIQITAIVDGQQRITTFLLIILAANKIMAEYSKNKEYAFDILKIKHNHSTNPNENKIYPKISYVNAFDENKRITEKLFNQVRIEEIELINKDNAILKTFNRIYTSLKNKFFDNTDEDLAIENITRFISNIRTKLTLVVINLYENDQNPLEIFENINSKTEELDIFEIIKNNIYLSAIVEANKKSQDIGDFHELIHKKYMLEIEENIAINKVKKEDFIYNFLRIFYGKVVKKNSYQLFKEYLRKDLVFEKNLDELLIYSKIYKNIVLSNFENPKIKKIIEHINSLDLKIFYPFLMKLLNNYAANPVLVVEILEYLDNIIVRRIAAQENKEMTYSQIASVFMNVIKDKEINLEILETLEEHYPSDENIKEVFQTKEFYKDKSETNNKTNFLLKILEKTLSNDNLPNEEDGPPHIEHIMPQELNLWFINNDILKSNEQKENASLHLIGNLTLINKIDNPSISNNSFKEKKLAYNKSRYLLTRNLCNLPVFNHIEIMKRNNELSKILLDLYPSKFENVERKELSRKIPDDLSKIEYQYRIDEGDWVDFKKRGGYKDFIKDFFISMEQYSEAQKIEEVWNNLKFARSAKSDLEIEKGKLTFYKETVFIKMKKWEEIKRLVIASIINLKLGPAFISFREK